jgi:membrane protein YqaA with SNARE-associated domain
VILVISGSDSLWDILPLTLVSLIAVTLAASVNYSIGYFFRNTDQQPTKIDYKKLLLSMIHINTLALFEAGKMRSPKWIIGIVGILNLPYYLLMIALVYQFQDAARELGENPYYLLIALIIWCGYSVWKAQKK